MIDAFEPWCWRRLESLLDCKEINQSILKEISPEYSLEGLMLNLKLLDSGHLMRTADSLEKTLMLGNIEGRRRRGREDEMAGWHHRLNGHGFEQTPGDGEGQRSLACHSPWGHKESDITERLNSYHLTPAILPVPSPTAWKVPAAAFSLAPMLPSPRQCSAHLTKMHTQMLSSSARTM